jgi:hypothetical protein
MPAIALVAPILPIREIVRAMNFHRRLGFSAHAWQDGDTYALLHRNGQSIPPKPIRKLIGSESPAATCFYLVNDPASAAGSRVLRCWSRDPLTLRSSPLGDERFHRQRSRWKSNPLRRRTLLT